MWVRTKHKISFSIVAGLVGALVFYTTNSAWTERISTIGTYQSDNSAVVRLLVWKWTFNYSLTHPFGGGFMSYLVDRVEIAATSAEPGFVQLARAFHSIYFELLGEQGYPGLIMFLAAAGVTFFRLGRSAKRARAHPELRWVVGLSDALRSGLAVFLTSGAFVGIAFQPMFWYFISLGISLNAYMWRVEHAEAGPVTGRRSVDADAIGARAQQTDLGGWRNRPPVSPAVNAATPRR
jgi:O-antigen ligase